MSWTKTSVKWKVMEGLLFYATCYVESWGLTGFFDPVIQKSMFKPFMKDEGKR